MHDKSQSCLFSASLRWRLWSDPSLFEAVVDDGALNVLDGDWRLVDAEHARSLARSGTDAAGELGEIVRLSKNNKYLKVVIAKMSSNEKFYLQ